MTRPSYGRFTDAAVSTPTEILASTVGLEKFGIQIDTAVSAKIVKGTLMGKVDSSGLYQPYNNGNSPAGIGVALGVLVDDYDPTVSADQADLRLAASMYIHGSFVTANLTAPDTGWKTDLGGHEVGAIYTF
jgi:hypothetical protein